MKKLYPPVFLAILLAVTATQFCFSQTLVNLTSVDTTTRANLNYPFQAGFKIDSNRVLILSSVANTLTGSAIAVTLYKDTGMVSQWQVTSSFPDSEFLTPTAACQSGKYIYGCFGFNELGTGSGFGVAKFTVHNGTEPWSNLYNSSGYYQLPAAIIADSLGKYIYVAGVEQTSATTSEVFITKIDSAGNQKWTATYDTAGMYSGAVAMVLNSGGATITFTGFSGNAWNNWDFITASIRTDSGIMTKPSFSAAGAGYSTPAGLVKDYSNHTYIAGTINAGSSSSRVRVIAYDTSFHQSWERTWGNADSLADSASRVVMDNNNDILITGYTTASNGARQLLVLKYNTGGTLQWSRTIPAPNPANNCVGKDITADANLNVYVTGYVYNGSNNDFITIAYDQNGNWLWQRSYGATGTNDVANDVILDNSGDVFVSGTSVSSSTSTYVTLEYQQWTPSICAASIGPSSGGLTRSTCPTITYNFENGQITTAGSDSFIEFDIYARQNTAGVKFASGDIIFTYNTGIFGEKIVDSSKITITRGTIISDTNYVITLRDTLFKSDAVPTNGKEVWLSVAARDTSGLYVIADTLQKLCHIKMAMKTLGSFGIAFDKFFMQNLSLYSGTEYLQIYNYVYTNGSFALAANDGSVTLYLSVTGCGGVPSSGTITATVSGYASSSVSVNVVYAFLSWDPSVISFTSDDVTQDPGNWVPVPNGSNANYASSDFDDNGTGYYFLDVSSNSMYTTLYSFPTEPSDIFDVVTFTYNPDYTCFEDNTELELVTDETGTLVAPSYFIPGGGGATMDFNVTLVTCGGDGPCCTGAPGPGGSNLTRGGGSCGTSGLETDEANANELEVYPNPFSNSFEVNFLLTAKAQVSLTLQNLLGQNILQTSFGTLTPGSYRKNINVPAQDARGIYILRLRVNDKEEPIKIIKE